MYIETNLTYNENVLPLMLQNTSITFVELATIKTVLHTSIVNLISNTTSTVFYGNDRKHYFYGLIC